MYLPCLLTWFHNFSVYLISGTYVPNGSISRNYKEIRNSTKISVTPVIHETRGGHVQRPLTCGPSGWPAVNFLGGDALQEVVEWNPMPGVDGGRANTWRVTNLIKSVTAPETPINTPLLMEFNTPHYTCSSPLVKVPV
jgi:hypothetical protein